MDITQEDKNEIQEQITEAKTKLTTKEELILNIKEWVKMDNDISKLKAEVNRNPVAVDHRKIGNHDEEKDLIETFEKNFKDLRANFNIFSAKWM